MKFDFDNIEKPLFIQIAEQIEDGILDDAFREGSQIPSSTEISLVYRLNPATVNKGVGLLVDKGIIEKKRGIGMFVALGAKEFILKERSEGFITQHIRPMLNEAKRLSLSKERIIEMIEQCDMRKNDKTT